MGRLLLEKNFSELRKRPHITNLTLDVWDRNKSARKFYEKMGFTQGETKQYNCSAAYLSDEELESIIQSKNLVNIQPNWAAKNKVLLENLYNAAKKLCLLLEKDLSINKNENHTDFTINIEPLLSKVVIRKKILEQSDGLELDILCDNQKGNTNNLHGLDCNHRRFTEQLAEVGNMVSQLNRPAEIVKKFLQSSSKGFLWRFANMSIASEDSGQDLSAVKRPKLI